MDHKWLCWALLLSLLENFGDSGVNVCHIEVVVSLLWRFDVRRRLEEAENVGRCGLLYLDNIEIPERGRESFVRTESWHVLHMKKMTMIYSCG